MYRLTAANAVALKRPDPAPLPKVAMASTSNPAALDELGAELYANLEDIFEIGGFAAVHRLCSAAQKRLAPANRSAVDAEGWIV